MPLRERARHVRALTLCRPAGIRLLAAMLIAIVFESGNAAAAEVSNPAIADSSAPASCWEQAAQRHQVNPHLLVAIAEVESGLRPASIGRNTNGSIDIGLMQINTLWLPELRRHGIEARDLLDPCVSVHVGAWVLAQKMRAYGNTWTAVGAYNAGSAVLRERYARKVAQALVRRAGAAGPTPSTATFDGALLAKREPRAGTTVSQLAE